MARSASPLPSRARLLTDVERAAAALRVEAVRVLDQAEAAAGARAGAAPQEPEEAGATLTEPEGEPLLSLPASSVPGEDEGAYRPDPDEEPSLREADGTAAREGEAEEDLGGLARALLQHLSQEAERREAADGARLLVWHLAEAAAERAAPPAGEELLPPAVAAEEPAAAVPLPQEPATEEPAAAVPLPEEPATEEPAAAVPLPEEPATEAARAAHGTLLLSQREEQLLLRGLPRKGAKAVAAALAGRRGGEEAASERKDLEEEPVGLSIIDEENEALATLGSRAGRSPAAAGRTVRGGERSPQRQHRQALVAAFCRKHGYADPMTPRRKMLKTKFAIHTAAKIGDADMVWMLLQEGADVAQKTSRGENAYTIAARKDRKGSHQGVLTVLVS